MTVTPWSRQEHQDVLDLDWSSFQAKYGDRRTYLAYCRRRQYLQKGDIPIEVQDREAESTLTDFLANKKEGAFDWRTANSTLSDMQDLKRRASRSQDTAEFSFQTGRPLKVITLADTHIGSWGTDHALLEKITDEILSIPDLYVILAGDIVQMAIRLRGVLEVSDNLLPPALQAAYLSSWFQEIEHRVLFTGWGNHEIRLEDGAGLNPIADIFSRKVVYFNGIGHADITVDDQTYRLAMSHKFRGRSQVDPTYGPRNYLVREGIDREVAIAGDSHIPGYIQFMFGNEQRTAINTGSVQTNSGFGKRYFSLYTHPVFPVFVLDNERHLVTPFWSVSEMQYVLGGSS